MPISALEVNNIKLAFQKLHLSTKSLEAALDCELKDLQNSDLEDLRKVWKRFDEEGTPILDAVFPWFPRKKADSVGAESALK